jgi:hypothetical protein
MKNVVIARLRVGLKQPAKIAAGGAILCRHPQTIIVAALQGNKLNK